MTRRNITKETQKAFNEAIMDMLSGRYTDAVQKYENVSEEGWKQWLERLTMIINENGLNTGDPQSVELIEKHMVGFLFGEGDFGSVPEGFSPPGAKK